MFRSLLAALFVLSSSLPALAVETMYEGDKDRALKEQIEETYGVYILNPSRRRPEEKVELKGDTLEMWLYYDPRKPDFDRMKCEGLKWILLGRFGKGGAQAFFNEYPKFNNVDMVVYQLDSKRTVDKEGKYTITKTPSKTMMMRLSRKKSDKLDWAAIVKSLDQVQKTDKDVATCVKTAERYVDRYWYSKEYFK